MHLRIIWGIRKQRETQSWDLIGNAEKDDYVWSILLFKVASIKIKSNNQSDPAEEITKLQMSWKYVHLFNILIYMVTYDFLNQFLFSQYSSKYPLI